ncbi:MAG: amidophosphoribosyltransferase [Spirochaetota bacterium]|nr:amidophosphoribosyltransferase [Spirochaetota bacterium]
MDDKFQDECGVFGIYSSEVDVSHATYLGLYALQHRGQESAGIAVSDGEKIQHYKRMGLVQRVFDEDILESLKGNVAIGHVRYSTTGESRIENAQPAVVQYKKGMLAVAHNGNLVNAKQLKKELEDQGSIFQTTVDSEVIIHLIARSKKESFREAVVEALQKVEGAYSLVLMTNDEVIGVRDPSAFRPLCVGTIEDSYCIASESCALEQIGAQYVRSVEPNEMVVIDKNGLSSYPLNQEAKISKCIFELIYLARPDSVVFDKSVYLTRREFGKTLAKRMPVDADLVIPVPDSGIPAAIGYSEESGIPNDMGLLRNHYVGRTFIQPGQYFRTSKVRIKLSPVSEMIKGKRVVVVDDSIVRGTTSREIVRMLRNAGAREIHLLSSSPPINYPCFYGIDTPNREELLAAIYDNDMEKIREYLGADSVGYLQVEDLLKVMGTDHKDYCLACFDGDYPISPSDFLQGQSAS